MTYVSGTLVRRYKRFLCDVILEDGTALTAHIANPGAMTSCLADRAPLRLTRSDDSKRKLAYSVEQIQVDGTWILVNTLRVNPVVGVGLRAGVVPELRDYATVESEVVLEPGHRVDFRLSGSSGVCWLEVKNVTLRVGERALFPDSRTERGTRHVQALHRARVRGDRAVLFLHLGRGDCPVVSPAWDIDPDWAGAVARAVEAGVEVICWRSTVDQAGVRLDGPVPFEL
jgi:sugar fermentation stimulation protein A